MGFTVHDMLHNSIFPGGFELLILKDSDRKHLHGPDLHGWMSVMSTHVSTNHFLQATDESFCHTFTTLAPQLNKNQEEMCPLVRTRSVKYTMTMGFICCMQDYII